MNQKIAGTAAAALLALGIAACGANGQDVQDTEWPEQDERGFYACYFANGQFARYDDDADCDRSDNVMPGLYRKHELPAPLKTSGGMQSRHVPGPTISHKTPVVKTTTGTVPVAGTSTKKTVTRSGR